MIIEDPTSLREWMSSELEALKIDADPLAVAKYGVALLAKDMPGDKLKTHICDDLTVFLQEHTSKFVEKLFETIESKSYLTSDSPADQEDEERAEEAEGRGEDDEENNGGRNAAISRRESKAQDSDDDLSDDDRDHRRTQKRSRSRSPAGNSERPRRLSPHRRLGYNNNWRGGPRGRRGAGGDVRNRLGGGRGGYRSDYNNRRYDMPPGGAGGGYYNNRRRSRSPGARRSLSPRRRSRSRSPRDRRSSLSPHGSRSPARDILSELTTGSANTNSKDMRPRCKDYDEKGFCLQGDLCQFSHGSDAVVMTDVSSLQLTSSSSSQQQTIPTLGGAPVASVSTVITSQQIRLPHNTRPIMSTLPVEPYNPEAPRMWRPPAHMGGPMARPPGYLPSAGYGAPPPQPYRGMRPPGPPGYRPRMMDPSLVQQPGGVARPRIYDPNRATLEVKNLPPEFNNIAKLNDHFSKFGTLINLQVQFEGKPDTALVTFSTNAEAKKAHQNPEPLFNNRFIKIFWHTPAAQATGADNSTQAQPKGPAKSRLGAEASNEPAPTKKRRVEPNMNPATLKFDNLAATRPKPVPHPNMPSATPPITKREAIKRQQAAALQKKAQELLLEQIKQQKTLLTMAEKCKNPQEKSELIKTIKQLDTSISKLKADMSKAKEAALVKERAAKELLDAEIDFHQKQQAGEDTEELQARLDDLKVQAAAMGIIKQRKDRANKPPRKPKALVVFGFQTSEKDDVIKHFKAFGPVTEKEFKVKPAVSVVVEYQTANEAKVASIRGVKFNDKNLILKWYKPSPPPSDSSTEGASQVASAALKERRDSAEAEQDLLGKPALEEEEDVLEGGDDLLDGDDDDEEALLLGDDDEEEDEKKRSW